MPAANHTTPLRPFLKWAGGKQHLLRQYQPYLPQPGQIGRYYEPFIGSAAVFFHVQPSPATLSDRNPNLIEAYRAVQTDVGGVIAALQPHRNDADYYYAIRAQNPADLSPVERAARLIYLNKTCYNGLYRENSRGEFNVPFGRYKNPKICDEERLRAASAALQGVTLCVDDFAAVVETAVSNDFIYFDPPYVPLNATSSFTSYSRHGFDEADQRRLAETIHQLNGRGCRIMLSNSDTPLVHELYRRPGYHFITIQARRNINSKAHRRGPVNELLIINYR
ncbi:MAG: DNA adenine methylase [Ardenticatenaceae bacterium]|nr:DNA adenine methylase [Anaerolineales bacterium]MCB8921507.1 DNA adenine methylase [Ardenticatenaceae bacterium]MCB8990914.1 DNA adenine methylase [Ardenticatenaceae bacterium]MCB9004981.1 DNA adenine methylase [Ardenticatenaceae bacterium]